MYEKIININKIKLNKYYRTIVRNIYVSNLIITDMIIRIELLSAKDKVCVSLCFELSAAWTVTHPWLPYRTSHHIYTSCTFISTSVSLMSTDLRSVLFVHRMNSVQKYSEIKVVNKKSRILRIRIQRDSILRILELR